MRGPLSQVFPRLLGAVALLGIAGVAQALDIRALHVSTAADSTRLILDVSGPLDYKLFEIGNPDRIVLDIRSAAFAPGFASRQPARDCSSPCAPASRARATRASCLILPPGHTPRVSCCRHRVAMAIVWSWICIREEKSRIVRGQERQVSGGKNRAMW